jgi:hypothetical protein
VQLVLSTQVSTVGLRLRHNRLTCGSILEVSRDALAAGEEQLACCAAQLIINCSICTAILGHCGDLPFTFGVFGSVFAAAPAYV